LFKKAIVRSWISDKKEIRRRSVEPIITGKRVFDPLRLNYFLPRLEYFSPKEFSL
jgi:hypothetical protein